jgi:hypothetical protein
LAPQRWAPASSVSDLAPNGSRPKTSPTGPPLDLIQEGGPVFDHDDNDAQGQKINTLPTTGTTDQEMEQEMADGTKDDPWQLITAPGSSKYTMYIAGDELICQVGATQLTYQSRAIDDLHTWLVEQGDWVQLGAADEQKPAAEGTVEAWGRSDDNPVGGWYGLRKGYRGRFGMYLPPLLEHLGRAQLTHAARNNAMRAI